MEKRDNIRMSGHKEGGRNEGKRSKRKKGGESKKDNHKLCPLISVNQCKGHYS
jgi:hypothetical protein